MQISPGGGTTKYGPGIEIDIDGDEVATAISEYLFQRGIEIHGPRTISVNGELCKSGHVYVDPSGTVVVRGKGNNAPPVLTAE